MATTFASPIISKKIIRLKKNGNVVSTSSRYVGNHPDGTSMVKYGSLWFKINGTDTDGIQYADLINGAYAF